MKVSRRAVYLSLFGSAIALRGIHFPDLASAQSATYSYDALGRLTHVVNADGSTTSYSYDAAGNRTNVVRPGPPPSPFTATIAIPSGAGVNLRTLANAAGYDGARNAVVTFTVASGVTVTGTPGAPNGGIAIDTGIWPSTLHEILLTLQVSGKAVGGGGKGGNGSGNAGGTGGDAVHCRLPMSVLVNSGAELKAGGGGGGAGGRARIRESGEWFFYAGGGGGGAAPNGPGGTASGATDGSPGTTSGGGAGGAGNPSGGGNGGAGGGYAANGVSGDSTSYQAGGVGGAAGYGVRKNGYLVSVTNNGTIAGTVG